MRIAIKAAQIALGGGLTHLNKIIEWFGRLEPEIEFVLIGKTGQEGFFVPAPRNFRYEFHKIPALNLAAQIWWERKVLPGILRKRGMNLLFEPGNRGTLAAPCPKVALVHNVAPFDNDYLRSETARQKIRQRLLRRATLESLRVADGVIFLSEFSRALIGRYVDISKIKSAIIYHGRSEAQDGADIDATLAKYGIQRPFILNVSHLWRYKKTYEMVAAYAEAFQRKPGLPPLYIAGTNYSHAYFAEISKFIARSGITERINFLGTVLEGDLPALYASCRAFLFPSVLEACPNILIEALSAGCAVACSNRGVLPEIAGGAALYFDPDDIGGFSRRIVSLVEDDGLNRRLGTNALERAAHFSWERTARETFDFFKDILGSPRRTSTVKTSKREMVEV